MPHLRTLLTRLLDNFQQKKLHYAHVLCGNNVFHQLNYNHEHDLPAVMWRSLLNNTTVMTQQVN